MQEREEPLPGLLYEARVRQPGLQQQLYPPQYLQEEHTPSGALVVRISTNAEEIRQQQAHHPSQQEGSVSSSASSHTSTSLKNSPLNVILPVDFVADDEDDEEVLGFDAGSKFIVGIGLTSTSIFAFFGV